MSPHPSDPLGFKLSDNDMAFSPFSLSQLSAPSHHLPQTPVQNTFINSADLAPCSSQASAQRQYPAPSPTPPLVSTDPQSAYKSTENTHTQAPSSLHQKAEQEITPVVGSELIDLVLEDVWGCLLFLLPDTRLNRPSPLNEMSRARNHPH